ncbi:serine/threonine-protein kinase [Parafrankia sp. EUN1f]|uniref:serine/threonine-protein kinase n=1 Tax=Parafrankia sp. EUN1f TaxID=102897 RepID=UPI0001C4709D|nr:serine/threonine-protein kinase [Parafrankia sp. EUN1f]EFC80212.1 serine/threonine protein kinase [Parafrankia sp. EUN1f]
MPGERRDAPDPAAPRVLIGRRYRLDGVIGRGGFGVVHRATDELLRRQVAVKEVLLPTDGSEQERELARERVLREARAAGRLHHPGAVAVLDVISEGDLPWIVMELVDGQALSKIIDERGALSVAEVCRIGISLAYALEAAHRLGIVHRDVKPSNVLVTGDQRARLTDFGIAVSHGDPRLTSTGMVLGSPAYLSPERARGDAGTAASDRWGLGATLFTSVEGASPFPGGDPIAVLAAVVQGRRRPFQAAGRLAPVIDELMAPSQAHRPSLATVRARMREILEQEERGRPHRTRSRPARPPVSTATPPPPGVAATPAPRPEPAPTMVLGASEETVLTSRPLAGADVPPPAVAARAATGAPGAAGAAGGPAVAGSETTVLRPRGDGPPSSPSRFASRLERVRAMDRLRAAAPDRNRDADRTRQTDRLRGLDRMRALGGIPARVQQASQQAPAADTAKVAATPPAATVTATSPDTTAVTSAPSAAPAPAPSSAPEGRRGTPATTAPAFGAVPTASVDATVAVKPRALEPRPVEPRPVVPRAVEARAVEARATAAEATAAEATASRPDASTAADTAAASAGSVAGSAAVAGAAAGETAASSSAETDAATRTGPRRRTVMLVATALVVVCAVIAILVARGGGTDEDSRSAPAPTSTVDPRAAAVAAGDVVATDSTPVVPAAGWVGYTDPSGWSIAYPATWESRPGRGGTGNMDFVDPETGTFMRIGSIATANTSAIEDWRRNEASFRDQVRDYQRVRIEPGDGADGARQADWEFTYASGGGGTVHVLNRGAVRNGHGYALYWHTPEELWATNQPLMQQLFSTFRPAS